MKSRNNIFSSLLIAGLVLAGGFDNSSVAEAESTGRGRRGTSRSDRVDNAPKVGDVAPLFTLFSQDGQSKTSLADFKRKKPVVLFLGSYT